MNDTIKSNWKSSLLGSLGVLAAVAIVLGGLVGYKYMQMQQMAAQGAPPETPTFVKLATAQPVSFRQHSSAIGTILAPQSITLSNEVAGTVKSINLPAGSITEPGAVLIELDSSIEQAQLESAKAAAKVAQSRYNRTREAFQSGALTAIEMDEAESSLTQANAAVAELEAVINKKTIVAPFRARVGISDTHVGQYLPSGTTITSLQSVDNYLYIDFTLPQNVAHSIQIGQPVSVETDQTSFTGQVEALDAQTDKLTRNLLVRARLDSAPAFMKPGDSVKVVVEYGPEIQAIAVPAEAVRRNPSGTQLFVATKDDQGNLRAHHRNIEIVQSMGNRVALLAGIVEGETVVTSGSFKLMDGGLLAIADDSADAPLTNANQP